MLSFTITTYFIYHGLQIYHSSTCSYCKYFSCKIFSKICQKFNFLLAYVIAQTLQLRDVGLGVNYSLPIFTPDPLNAARMLSLLEHAWSIKIILKTCCLDLGKDKLQLACIRIRTTTPIARNSCITAFTC